MFTSSSYFVRNNKVSPYRDETILACREALKTTTDTKEQKILAPTLCVDGPVIIQSNEICFRSEDTILTKT